MRRHRKQITQTSERFDCGIGLFLRCEVLRWATRRLRQQRKSGELLRDKEAKPFEFMFYVAQMESAKLVIVLRLFKLTPVAHILNHITFTALPMAGRMHPSLSPPSAQIATAKFITAQTENH